MRTSVLRQRLTAGQPLFVMKCNIPHPMVIELFGLNGIECLWLDCEHFPIGVDAMAGLIQACRGADVDSLVRLPNGAYSLAAQLLDAGADAIMYPRCRCPEDIARLVEWCRFPPVGQRGLDTGIAAADYGRMGVGEHLQRQNREPVLVVQIETAEAVDAIDEICSVPGIDVLFFGPADYSAAIGLPGELRHPRVQEALEKVIAAAKAHKLGWGTPALDMELAAWLTSSGATLITAFSDTSILREAISTHRSRFQALGIPFRPDR